MQVKLFEAREALGGRAYLWEKDGFRFDMGPSWYLMPDAFEQFFNLMGTTADKELDLVRLTPAYQTRNEGLGDRLVMSEKLPEIKEMFESIEPGSGKQLQRYLDSAQEAYELSIKHFLYTNFKDLRSFLHPEVLAKLAPRLSPAALDWCKAACAALMEQADRALYLAKHSGRNQVRLAE